MNMNEDEMTSLPNISSLFHLSLLEQLPAVFSQIFFMINQAANKLVRTGLGAEFFDGRTTHFLQVKIELRISGFNFFPLEEQFSALGSL